MRPGLGLLQVLWGSGSTQEVKQVRGNMEDPGP